MKTIDLLIKDMEYIILIKTRGCQLASDASSPLTEILKTVDN
jgi:hypothetical protein